MGVDDVRGERAVDIRPATAADYDAIVRVWSACGLGVSDGGRDGRESFARQCSRFGDLYLVAEIGDTIVGVVLGTHDERKGWINRLAVLPDERRRGIAARLVTTCDEAIRARGIEIVATLVEPSNPESCALFEKLGFRTDVAVRYFRKLSRPGA